MISGVDHIGHSQGDASQLMKPKLIQMDQVIQKIWNIVCHASIVYRFGHIFRLLNKSNLKKKYPTIRVVANQNVLHYLFSLVTME